MSMSPRDVELIRRAVSVSVQRGVAVGLKQAADIMANAASLGSALEQVRELMGLARRLADDAEADADEDVLAYVQREREAPS